MATFYVTLTYDLPEESGCHNLFKETLEGLGWRFSIEDTELPNTTCIKEFPGESDELATETAVEEISEVVTEIRKTKGLEDFVVSKYFALAHPIPGSFGLFGHDLK